MKKIELDDKLKISNADKDSYIFNIENAMIYRPNELKFFKEKNNIFGRYKKDNSPFTKSNLVSNFFVLEDGDDLEVINQKEQKRTKKKIVTLNSSIQVVDGIHPFNKWLVLFIRETYGDHLVVKDNQIAVTCLRILKNFLCKKAYPQKKAEILFDQLGTTYNEFLEFIRNYKGL